MTTKDLDLTTADIQQCSDVATRFFWNLDHDRYEDVIGLMAPECVWYRQGLELRPDEETLRVLRRRSPTRSVVHLLSNQAVRLLQDGHRAEFTAYLTAYAHDSGEKQLPAPLEGPTSIGRVRMELVLLAKLGWRVASSKTMPIFKRQDSTQRASD